MKKWFSVAVVLTSLLTVTACTQSEYGPITRDQSKQAQKEWSEEAKPSTYAPAVGRTTECLNTLNVIALGNPGPEGGKVIQATYNAIQKKLSSNSQTANLKVSLTTPSYNGSDHAMVSYDSLTNGDMDVAKEEAAKAAITAVSDAQDKCAGSKTILLGYGVGSSSMHRVEMRLSNNMEKSISRIVLVRDPTRTHLDAIDTFDTKTVVAKSDGTAGGSLPFNGYAGTYSLTGDMNKKMLAVCSPTDAICNWNPRTDHPSGTLDGLESDYLASSVTETISNWVSENTADDLKVAQESHDNGADITAYLKYLNRDGIGAQVVQDTKEPAAVTSCDADYAVFATRGSGENISGNDNTGDGEIIDNASGYQGGKPAQSNVVLNGITRFPATIAWEIKSKLPSDKKIRFMPVQYDAVKVPGVDKNSTNVVSYMNSVDRGVAQMTSDLTNFEKQCPQTPIVVIGYSQGAQVTHTAISKLPESATKQIKSVLLIADPLMDTARVANNGIQYNPNDKGGSFNKYLKDYKGISSGFGIAGIDIPAYVSSKVVQICDINDPICDFAFGTDIEVHSSAYSQYSHYGIPAWLAAEKLNGTPLLGDKIRQELQDQLSSAKKSTSTSD